MADLSAKIQDFTEKIKQAPKRVDLVFGRGTLYRQKQDYQNAIDDFTTVLNLEPGHRSAYVLRGEAYRKLGQEGDAITDYTKALFIDPADVEAYLVRGQANLKAKHYDDAIRDFTKAMDLVPNSIPALLGRAEGLRRKAKYDEALFYVNKALLVDPESLPALILLAKIYMSSGEFDKAFEVLNKLLEQDPSCVPALLTRAEVYRRSGQYNEAIADYTKVLELGETRPLSEADRVDALYGRGETYRLMEEYQKAFDDCTIVLTLDPRHAGAMVVLGECHRIAWQEYEKAVDFYTRALELEPHDFETYIVRADAYTKLRQFDKAIKDLTIAIGMDPKHLHAYVGRCEAYRLKGQYELALQDYRTAVHLGYIDANGFIISSILHKHKGDYVTAIYNCKQALQLEPQFADAYLFRGISALLQENVKMASNDFNKALDRGVSVLPSPMGPPRVITSKDGFDKGVLDMVKALELVPRHTYKYSLKVNFPVKFSPEELLQMEVDKVNKMMIDFGFLDDETKHALYDILNDPTLSAEEKMLLVMDYQEQLRLRKAKEVRDRLTATWERLKLPVPLRGMLYEEILYAQESEAAGNPVDMELVGRVENEIVKLDTMGEVLITECFPRYQEWGKVMFQCEECWNELSVPHEERKHTQHRGWELTDEDVDILKAQRDELLDRVAEKRKRDAEIEGATHMRLMQELIVNYDKMKGLWEDLATPQKIRDKPIMKIGTDIRQSHASIKTEMERLSELKMERTAEIYNLFDRLEAAFTLLKTKPAVMRNFFKWEHTAPTKANLASLVERVEHQEFAAQVPAQKIVLKEKKATVRAEKKLVKFLKGKEKREEKKAQKAKVRAAKVVVKEQKAYIKSLRSQVKERRDLPVQAECKRFLKKKLYKRMKKQALPPLLPVLPEEFPERPKKLKNWLKAKQEGNIGNVKDAEADEQKPAAEAAESKPEPSGAAAPADPKPADPSPPAEPPAPPEAAPPAAEAPATAPEAPTAADPAPPASEPAPADPPAPAESETAPLLAATDPPAET